MRAGDDYEWWEELLAWVLGHLLVIIIVLGTMLVMLMLGFPQ